MNRFRDIGTALAALSAVLLLAACGSGSGAGSTRSLHLSGSSSSRASVAAGAATLRYRPLGSLPAPTQDAAGAPAPGGVSVLAGGLSAADQSTDEVWTLGGAHLVASGHLPGPQHDAQAAAVGGQVYVFGGANFNQYDHVLRVAPGGSVTSAGHLPTLASDVAAASAGDTGYVVGGYDGSQALATIVAYRPGTGSRVLARLPVALRYAAVAVAGGRLIIAGGSTPVGASREVYALDLSSGRVAHLARLPRPLTHAAAGVIGSTMYLIGGRGDAVGTPTASILAIDPVAGTVRRAGRLPRALSDLTAVSQPGAILIYGGRTADATVASIGRLSTGG